MPIRLASLPATLEYEGAEGCAIWEGYAVPDAEAFRGFLGGAVASRLHDAEETESFEEELRGLAATGVATEFLEAFLTAVPETEPWEVGEALAETVLAEDQSREVIWPWNQVRDRRTPRASLPGADLVGFCCDETGACLLFGEVKTSQDSSSPPQVMYGSGGMTWQLESNATELDKQHALLRWLRFRCRTPDLEAVYREAVSRYLESDGAEILITGVLLRDTPCNEKDVESRARHLGVQLEAPTRVEVLAWYLPIPVDEWVKELGGTT